MTKRENLLWQIILAIAFLAISYNVYVVYLLSNDSNKLWNNYINEDIGTDKILQTKVQRLEVSLQNKRDFIFKMKKNPSDLSAVIDFDGINSMGIYRHFKLESIYFNNSAKEYKAFIKADIAGKPRTFKITKNDSVVGGKILSINEDGLIFKIDGEIFNYKLGENND